MKSIQLKLETVTPMFLHGADNQTLELRPPPFKALFRYWWRATVGKMNVDNLHKEESRLFGNTQGRSPLSIRIPSVPALPFDECAPLPHKSGSFKRQAYRPNSTFNLKFVALQLNQYRQIAEISFLLGGVGNRSRRGFGSIRYQDWSFQTVAELEKKVYQTLIGISPGRFQENPNKIQVDPTIRLPDYPVIKAVHFSNTLWDNVNDLLRRIGQATHDHSDNALGSASPRMASPIHVRIQKIGNKFVPIVTQLNSVFPGADPHNYKQKQVAFIAAILA